MSQSARATQTATHGAVSRVGVALPASSPRNASKTVRRAGAHARPVRGISGAVRASSWFELQAKPRPTNHDLGERAGICLGAAKQSSPRGRNTHRLQGKGAYLVTLGPSPPVRLGSPCEPVQGPPFGRGGGPGCGARGRGTGRWGNPGGMKRAGRPGPFLVHLLRVVAGTGFEPVTSGL
jgi:hypothetical protein